MNWRQRLAESRQKSLEASNKIREELKQGKERHFHKLLEEATRQEAYLLWEADENPKDKDEYYWNQAVERLRDFYLRNEALKRLQKKEAKKQCLLRRFAAWWETTPIECFLEDVAFILKNAAILDVINLAASITIILSLATWWVGRQERREDEQFSTWGVLQNVHGDKSGVARVAAQRFNRQGFSLAGLDFQEANLHKVDLRNANLFEANFSGADLRNAEFQGSYLVKVNFEGANLAGSNFEGADLEQANFEGANLASTEFEGAVLTFSNLTGTNLTDANFQNTNLESAEFKGAILLGTDFRQADFSWFSIEDALICNPGTSFDFSPENIDWTRDCSVLRDILEDFYFRNIGPEEFMLGNTREYIYYIINQLSSKEWE